MLKKVLNNYKSRSCLATNPYHNDVYIVEYPKSGITWLSNIIANLSLLESNRMEIANFCSGLLYIPDIHISRFIGPMPYNSPPVRFIKSHDSYNPYYNFVIYLARHPLHVMKSYYRHISQRNTNYHVSFMDFIKDKKYGITKWKNHINNWLTGSHTSQRIYLIKYEDLLKNTYLSISELFDNYGWCYNEDNIIKAIKLSSIENMKKSETLFKLKNPRYNACSVKESFNFENLEEAESFVHFHCRNELELLGY